MGPLGVTWGLLGPIGAPWGPMGAPMGPPWAPYGQPACRPAGNPAFIFRGVISPKQRPKIWQGISPTVCQNASWTHLVVFSRRFYIGRTEGELTIFHQTPISSTDTIDFCSTGHFQVGAKSSFFRGVISGKQGRWRAGGGWAAGGGRFAPARESLKPLVLAFPASHTHTHQIATPRCGGTRRYGD